MSLKDDVADAKPLTEQHMGHLVARKRGANQGELLSLIKMVLDAGGAPAKEASKPEAGKPKKKAGDEAKPEGDRRPKDNGHLPDM